MTNELIRQYAIRKPDGQLWERPTESILGGLFGTTSSGPTIFDSFDSALRTLQRLQEEAWDRLGVRWYGTIESRLCTPFSVTDPSARLVEQIQEWMGSE
ncbi:hypothetical protein PBI_VELVETEEN_82 [Mycobacterium phage Velveteen]|uniref:Uncharacterized protein n=3 Tax=Cheoctovirus TaxID=1623281 RepID=G1DU67_9CAUD|nr:hypothetical protein N858_gp082 [Mycobacterium phage Velveteen]YP_009125935.1 hypothetical protein VC45_gp082 [Mycobacterium phage Cerasum]YP_009608268.1 hypothetical protein FDI16_gp086 [Mycobacterium phage Shauna1]YP_009636499.1 hypothetical protein FGG21_gp086 [Mycobacterium phage DLane]ARM70680.1 hypothetical protein SEA_KINGSLEY_92 [Mycobacterium phage Kingsley]AVR76472.1 hypothetical protein SEA_BIGPHIL_81 [Mycobacterium phage BigPhil]QIQ63778.1 hypothetical protein SEA_PHANPHAGIA_89